MDTSPESTNNSIIDLGTRTAVCETHGAFESKGMQLNFGRPGREIWSDCPGCKADREQAERESRERDRLDQMLRASGIPARMQGCTFASYIVDKTDGQKAAKRAVIDYVEAFEQHRKTGDSLILAGKPGTGKGHLAAAAMNRLMPRYQPIYTTCLDMIRSIRECWRKDARFTESQVLQELEEADLLIIDEIGVQYGTAGEEVVVFDVLDRRYRQMRPSILITNQDPAGFRSFVGERGYDRLRQTAKWITFDWLSHRAGTT